MDAGRVRKKLLRWYSAHQRELPWRRDRDPYRVWVSEIMLQQTRVAAAVPYYERFLARFPAVEALARARPQSVLRAWAGLGYYSRARSLHAAARKVVAAGRFPATYEEWKALPGIGAYTAAALSSIVLGLPFAVVDGNVRRVLARLHADDGPTQQKADALLDRRRPGDFNQALMELGATVCLPRAPLCGACPLASQCRALAAGAVEKHPRPGRPLRQESVVLKLALVERDGAVLFAPPATAGLWAGFWRLPSLPGRALTPLERLGAFRHTVTFRDIRVEVFRARHRASPNGNGGKGLRFLRRGDLARLPIATPSRKALALFAGGLRPADRSLTLAARARFARIPR